MSSAANAGKTHDLELRGLVKRFGGTTAVDGLSLSVEKGEFITFLGPSGCGKTTALRAIAGYETIDEGDVIIRGRSMSRVPPYRRNVGMVFQNYALFPHLNVGENVGFGLKERRKERGAIRRAVADALRLVRLEGLDDRYPSQLSGGQQQRVALARALVIEPELLLLDEPLSNLDAKLREEMRVEIKQLQEKLGITTIFVTHDQIEALTLSTRVVVMQAGKIAQIGTPIEVYSHPQNRFVFEFLGGTNLLPGKIVRQDGTRALFQTSSGLEIVGVRSNEMASGAQAFIGIRPEAVSLAAPTAPREPNHFPAKIVNVLFKGWTRELILRLASGDVITGIEVLLPSQSAVNRPGPDDDVVVSLQSLGCRVLRDA